jgi:hypothetical protein
VTKATKEPEPHELPPRGVLRVPTDLSRDDVAAFRDGFVGVVWLATGEQLTSDVKVLRDDLIDEVESYG